MGLIAVVYLAKQNLSFDMVKEGAEQDARTGAIYFQDTEKKKKYPREMRQAIRIKLGTSFEISDIAKELGPMLGAAESVLTDRVLYDLSHSGDLIATADLDRLESEVKAVRERVGSRGSKLLTKFLADMCSLVTASRRQNNPIVFV